MTETTSYATETPALAKPIESRVLLTGTSVTYHCAPEDDHLESRWFVDGWPQDEGGDFNHTFVKSEN